MTLLELKKQEIYKTLVACGGNKTKAAELLDMSIRSLRDLTNHDPMFHAFRRDPEDARIKNLQQEEKQMNQTQQIQKTEEKTPEVFDTKEVVTTLNRLMNKVTDQECTAETVNAACNCASQITQLLRVHLDVERLKRKFT